MVNLQFLGQNLLTEPYDNAILNHMKTTLNIDDELLRHAREVTGITEKTALVRLGLEALIAWQSARRLAALAGSEPTAKKPRRRRSR